MRVALVHDWLTGMGGGEYVLEGMIELSGTLIREQTPETVIEAVDRAEATPFNSEEIRVAALRYAPNRFLERFSTFIDVSLENIH